jgi:dCTP deaminase
MLMTDGEIRAAMASGKLRIDNFGEPSLQAASYDMRIGARLLISSQEQEFDLSQRQSVGLKAGEFALVTTHEGVRLSNDLAGHIGVKSYYTRKGLVVLSGLQIDPGFEGILVIGLYNASPRTLILEYLEPFCTVEFHQLGRPVEKPFMPGPEQKEGRIPRVDKDYLRTLETQSLSEMSKSLRELSVNVATVNESVKTMKWTMGIGFAFLSVLLVVL